MSDLLFDKLNEFCDLFLKDITNKDFESCKKNTVKAYSYYNTIIDSDKSNSDQKNCAMYYSVFFKSIEDFTDIAILTEKPEWFSKNEEIELVWNKMWNCRERLNFTKKKLRGNVSDYLEEQLNVLEKYFLHQFGQGLYSSPIIQMKGMSCNICQNNFKFCEHKKEEIYNGEICLPKPISPEIISSDLVRVPKDPRCRLWPWQMKENMVFKTCIKTFFQVDDFLI